MTRLDDYLKKLADLNANKNRRHWTAATTHRAPHKPLLLLAIIDLFEQNNSLENFIALTPDLIELFGIYWQVVNPPSQRADIFKPFFHLHNDGFWHLVPVPGAEERLKHTRTIVSMSQLEETVLGATLDEELFALWQTENGRTQSRVVLITTYFSHDIQQRLQQQTIINEQAYQYSLELLKKKPTTIDEMKPEYQPIRDQGFRRAIVKAYDHRCAICGLRILTADGHTAVAAAHIIPWSISHNDDPRNGLALCHLCHWTFDEGLVAFSDHYHVKISPQLSTLSNLPGHLLTFADRKLIGPQNDTLWPLLDSIRWHRQEKFRSR